MIHKVRIKNFKAIHDTGELKLTDLNALIGNNGTGKSSIIEAMEVLQIVVATGDVTKAFFKYGSNLSEYLLKIFQDTITRDNIISKMEYILPYISDIRPALVQDTIRKIFLEMTEKNSSFRIPGWLLSSGTLRILNLLSILSAQDLYPIIFIEEIENGLDPKTIHFLIEEIRNFLYDENKQVVFTSHSPYLLDLLHISHIIVVEKDKSNQTRFYRPNRKKIKEWSKQFAPGKLYTMGSLKKYS